MPENLVRKAEHVAPEIPDFNPDNLNDEVANDDRYIIVDDAFTKKSLPNLTRKGFTPEAIYLKRIEIGNQDLNRQDPIFPELTDDTITETIVADDVLKPMPVVIENNFPPLSREDFDEKVIMARKLALLAKSNPDNKNVPQFNESEIEKIDMTDALSKPILTRADFTPQGIAEALKKAQGLNPESNDKLPDHLKIETNLRVPSAVKDNLGLAPTVPVSPIRTIPVNKLGSGIPETNYKIKLEPTPKKKSLFGRLVPKFISRFF